VGFEKKVEGEAVPGFITREDRSSIGRSSPWKSSPPPLSGAVAVNRLRDISRLRNTVLAIISWQK
jgi:hypothetical protein